LLKGMWLWLDARLQVRELLRTEGARELPAGTGWLFVLGSLALSTFLVLVVTGVLILFVYIPSPDHAADSLYYLHQMNFGRFIHGVHHWGASAMIVIVFLHLLRVFFFKAFARPRELTWIVGIVLLLFTLAMGFTGFLLPWDPEGYWGTVVGLHIAEQSPLVGGIVGTLLRGGAVMGTQTLSRFFALHVAVLPALMVVFIVIHLRLVSKLGSAGPLSTPLRGKDSGFAFFPRQVLRDATAALVVLLLISALAMLLPLADRPPADPTDTQYIPRPPWYFLSLFQFLRYVPGRLEPIAAVVIPGLIVLFLLLVPFIDRRPGRAYLKGRPVAWLVSAGVALAITLGVLAGPNPNTAISPLATGPVPPGADAGQQLYLSVGCGFCHGSDAGGTKDGPSLHKAVLYRDRPWLLAHFKDPAGLVPGSTMKKFDWLTDDELHQLVDHLIQINRENRPW